MNYGLTENGFVKKELSVIKAEMEASIKAALGSVDVSSGSVFGQIIGVLAEREYLIWERDAEVYLGVSPKTAQGRSLDFACQLTGIYRLAAARSTVVGALKGDEGTVVPAGSQVKLDGSADTFRSLANLKISYPRKH